MSALASSAWTVPSLRTPIGSTLWGDGFASDSLQDMCGVSDWDFCAPDEYSLIFPRLLPRDGRLPVPLRSHLETCVAVRAWRLSESMVGQAPLVLTSRLPDEAYAAQCYRDWFAERDASSALMWSFRMPRVCPARVTAERTLLTLLDEILFAVQRNADLNFDAAFEAQFAFGSGIHPAYLWPECLLSHARGMTAAWLGHLDRGRAALMPPTVAEYVIEALDFEVGIVDAEVARMVGGSANLVSLRRSARKVSKGGNPTVRLRRSEASLWSRFRPHPRKQVN